MRRLPTLLLIGALGLLIGALAVGGLMVWMGDDDDAESRRTAALPTDPPPDSGSGPPVSPAPGPQPQPDPVPTWPNGGDLYEFRGSATNLLQPPGGTRVAIAGTLPPGRYYLFGKANMGSFNLPSTPMSAGIGSINYCDLTDSVSVLDRTYTTHVFPGGYATSMLSAKYEVTNPAGTQLKVVCFNMTGGHIGSRVLTAFKVG